MTPSKSTTSACPQCLRKIPARLFERDGRVYLSTECPTHGVDEALLGSVHHWPITLTDRAQCDGDLDGFVKVTCDVDRSILGATIVAARAGEMIGEFSLAVQRKLTLADLAAKMHAYPTWSMAVQQLASDATVSDFTGSTSGRLATRLGAGLR
jgi:hypothetical protein